MCAALATAMAGMGGWVVSMWKVTTPVGRSIRVFSVVSWVPLYTLHQVILLYSQTASSGHLSFML